MPTSDRRDPAASVERVAHRDGAAASPTGARTTRSAPEAGAAARERVLLVSLQGVIKNEHEKRSAVRGKKTALRRPFNL